MRGDRRYQLRALQLRQGLEITGSDDTKTTTRTLVGEAGLDDWMTASAEDGTHIVPLTQLKLTSIEPVVGEPDRYRPVPYAGFVSARRHEIVGGCLLSELHARLPSDVFDSVWEMAGRGAEVWLSFETGGSNDAALKLQDADDYDSTAVVVRGVHCHTNGATPLSWLAERRVWQLRGSLQRLNFAKGWDNQVSRICQELAEGLARIGSQKERFDKLQVIVELIAEARMAFREPLKGTGETYDDNAYSLDKAKFEAFVLQFDEKRQGELKTSFDKLWQHFNLSSTLQSGEAAVGPVKYGLRCAPEELDAVASKYFALGDVRSPTLEWALLSALTFSECLGFAQHLHSDKLLLGRRIPEPINPKNAWHQARSEFKTWLGQAFAELAKLGLSFAVAGVLTQGNQTAAWVVMTGYTVWRWMRKVILGRELTPRLKSVELLSKMEWVSDSFKRMDFNSQGVRQQIYAAMHEGASFSPWVLNLLDRQSQQ